MTTNTNIRRFGKLRLIPERTGDKRLRIESETHEIRLDVDIDDVPQKLARSFAKQLVALWNSQRDETEMKPPIPAGWVEVGGDDRFIPGAKFWSAKTWKQIYPNGVAGALVCGDYVTIVEAPPETPE